jgi:hypothetical protein
VNCEITIIWLHNRRNSSLPYAAALYSSDSTNENLVIRLFKKVQKVLFGILANKKTKKQKTKTKQKKNDPKKKNKKNKIIR